MSNLSPITSFLCPCGAENHAFTEWAEDAGAEVPVMCWCCDALLARLPGARIWTSSGAAAAQALREDTPLAVLHASHDVIPSPAQDETLQPLE